MHTFPAIFQPHFIGEKREGTDLPDLWRKCLCCGQMVYVRQLADQHKVCWSCGYHFHLTPDEWVELILDAHSFTESECQIAPEDPLAFQTADGSYADKLQRVQDRLGQREAVICGQGTCDGLPIAIAVSDFRFFGGSMGSVYGEKIARTIEYASERGMPFVSVSSSGGARMHEGILSLMQMAKAAVALQRLIAARQPHIAILTDPCYGGVTASYASVADVVLAEPCAHIGFAGPRVIEQTIHQQLPPDFQTAEFLLAHGMIDAIVSRDTLKLIIAQLVRIHAP